MSPPIVSIVTRTRDRPVLLKRAVQSVLGQDNPPDLEWVVVNDSGNPETVEEVLIPAREQLGAQLKVLHLSESKGMEHASNNGMAETEGEYIVIHDDDDSWDSTFLRKMSDWLAREEHAKFAGVVCHSILVEESMEEDSVEIVREYPFNDWLKEISSWRMLEENSFPPISFLFRKSAWLEVGPFDESLPVLGDWEFNIRLILRHPIGVLPEKLANYHHRTRTTEGSLANSITAGEDRHRKWDRILRERWEESPPMEGLTCFGEMARIARANKDTRDRTHQLLSLPLRPGPQL